MITGQCLCGQINYQINAKPLGVGNCHCNNCRRTSGAAFSSWVYFEKSKFSLQGQLVQYKSSDWAERGFCSRCGSQVICYDSRLPDCVALTVGSLDEPSDIVPQLNVWTSNRLSWLHSSRDLPDFPEDLPMELIEELMTQNNE